MEPRWVEPFVAQKASFYRGTVQQRKFRSARNQRYARSKVPPPETKPSVIGSGLQNLGPLEKNRLSNLVQKLAVTELEKQKLTQETLQLVREQDELKRELQELKEQEKELGIRNSEINILSAKVRELEATIIELQTISSSNSKEVQTIDETVQTIGKEVTEDLKNIIESRLIQIEAQIAALQPQKTEEISTKTKETNKDDENSNNELSNMGNSHVPIEPKIILSQTNPERIDLPSMQHVDDETSKSATVEYLLEKLLKEKIVKESAAVKNDHSVHFRDVSTSPIIRRKQRSPILPTINMKSTKQSPKKHTVLVRRKSVEKRNQSKISSNQKQHSQSELSKNCPQCIVEQSQHRNHSGESCSSNILKSKNQSDSFSTNSISKIDNSLSFLNNHSMVCSLLEIITSLDEPESTPTFMEIENEELDEAISSLNAI